MTTRTLDLSAAREVLGLDVTPMLWHEYRRDPEADVPSIQSKAYLCQRCGVFATKTEGIWSEASVCAPTVAPYSTDLAAAWQLVEHAQEAGFYCRLCAALQWSLETDPGICEDMGWLFFEKTALEAAEAITRAALSAVRGQEVGRDE